MRLDSEGCLAAAGPSLSLRMTDVESVGRRGRGPVLVSGNDRFKHFAEDVGEAHVSAAPAVGEAFVVHAQEVKHGGVEVLDFGFVLGDFVAVLVGGAVGCSALDAAAGEPEGEAVGVV